MAKDLAAPSEKWMRLAIELASRGAGWTHPNPAVGAVVVKNGKLAGAGYHAGPGLPHAEVLALREAGKKAEGSDLYVTLEPCPTYGRTPPCTDAILCAGVGRVIAGTRDPNPRVDGRGLSMLEKNGVTVVEGFMKDGCVALDAPYHVFYRKRRPHVTLKWAQSMDGATARAGGGYITGPVARKLVHQERFLSDAILVTSGTVLRDEPRLTVRLPGKKKKLLRIVVDRHGLEDLPDNLKRTAPESGGIWIIRTKKFKVPKPSGSGVEVFDLACGRGLDAFLPRMLRFLREKQIMSLYVEAVGELATALLDQGFVDRLSVHVAPLLLGKGSAPAAFSRALAKPVSLDKARERVLGRDRIYEADLEGKCLRD